MLNREDVRKVLEAHNIIVNRLKENKKDIADIPMKEIFDLVLGEIRAKEIRNEKS